MVPLHTQRCHVLDPYMAQLHISFLLFSVDNHRLSFSRLQLSPILTPPLKKINPSNQTVFIKTTPHHHLIRIHRGHRLLGFEAVLYQGHNKIGGIRSRLSDGNNEYLGSWGFLSDNALFYQIGSDSLWDKQDKENVLSFELGCAFSVPAVFALGVKGGTRVWISEILWMDAIDHIWVESVHDGVLGGLFFDHQTRVQVISEAFGALWMIG